jgi:hypothetical protein
MNYGIINEQQIGKDVKENGQGLISGTVSGYGRRNREKSRKSQSGYSMSLPKFEPAISQT